MFARNVLTLARFTRPSLMVPRLKSNECETAIAELGWTLARETQVPEVRKFLSAVLTRERLSSTLASRWLALPHARLPEVTELSFVVGRTVEPLAWFGAASAAVRVVFLFAVPETEAATYLTLMSGIARLCQDNSLAEQLITAPDSASMFEVLEQLPLRQPRSALQRS